MPVNEYQLNIKVSCLSFMTGREIGTVVARLNCILTGENDEETLCTAHAHYDRRRLTWVIRTHDVEWLGLIPSHLVERDNLRAILGEFIRYLKVLWFKPILTEGEEGARIQVGQAKITRDQFRDAFLIVRHDLLDRYQPEWPTLWPAIEERVANDPEFAVQGFDRATIKRAVETLKPIYPWEWVKSKYKLARGDNSEPEMNDRVDADFWFPAHQLARTALGVTCKDPGWNYLATLAAGVETLRQYEGGQRLIAQIPSNPGVLHQASFGSYLHERGILSSVNHSTGSGSDTHDFLIRGPESEYDVEMKALTSNNPARRIKREISERIRRLPSTLPRPLILYAVLVDKGQIISPKVVDQYLSEIQEECFCGSPKFTAIVAGTMFVDSAGGPVKWSFEKVLLNPQAEIQKSEDEIRSIFAPNWTELYHPLLSIVTTFEGSTRSDG